jgi:hypothetical protein
MHVYTPSFIAFGESGLPGQKDVVSLLATHAFVANQNLNLVFGLLGGTPE